MDISGNVYVVDTGNGRIQKFSPTDTFNGFTIGVISGNTNENGTQAAFTVKLNSQPTDDVTIPVSSNDTSEGMVSPTSLTFTSANWDINQTVTVTGVDDNIVDGTQNYKIILGVTISSDADYNGLDPADISITNIDNDNVITVPLGNIDTTSPGSANLVDGHDLYKLSRAFGSVPIDSNWNLKADLNNDGIIDGNDLTILASNFGKQQ